MQLALLSSGVERIVRLGAVKKYALFLQQISVLCSILFSQSLMLMLVLFLAKILKFFSKKLTKCWDETPLDVVRTAVNDFPKRLQCVVKTQGKHFEYKLCNTDL